MKKLLIIGCGDVALRALPALRRRYQVLALVRTAEKAASVQASGATVLFGDLDHAESLRSLACGAHAVLHLAPPPESGAGDARSENLIAALSGCEPECLVYISTSAVYGDCQGERIDETREPAPASERGARRLAAERTLLAWGGARGTRVAVLRVPGIYALERLPLAYIRRGLPVLRAEDDIYTNHVHADDLAQICEIALERGAPGGIYNASDDGELKMGDYFDLIAERAQLPRPPRVTRIAAEAGAISPGMLSFMRESRRLLNARLKTELGVQLRYPTVYEGIPRRIVA